MSRPRLSNLAARRIFLDRHALLEAPQGPAQGDDLLSLIDRLGFVQLDSINTLARAHDLILFSRRPRYRPEHLTRLYARGDALFEHWTHDAAIIPMAFHPQWRLRRERDATRLLSRWQEWRREGFIQQLEAVKDHIRQHGPCGSSDVGQDEKRSSGGWWDWHPSKTALEYLWRSGELHVVGRQGFQKRYDLSDRSLPPEIYAPANPPSDTDIINWCCNSALDRLGFATSGELTAFWDHLTAAEAKDWCATQKAAGHLIDLVVENADGSDRTVLARPDILDDPATQKSAPSRLRVLSPFDPALRDRKRAERLFGFSYRIEIFVPAPKRKYGYYVFPILEGERIIGRVDMKAHRDMDELRIQALWPERGVRWGKTRQAAFETEAERLTRLAGVTQVVFQDGWLRTQR